MLLPLHMNGLNLDSGTVVATITGTILTAGEADIQSGGRTIVITLTNDTWVAAGAAFDAQRQNILDGLDSDGSELGGWNNEVRDSELVTAVVRTSDTVVTITLTAAPNYDITASETVTVTVPATALVTSGSAVTGVPTFTIEPFVPARKGGRIRRKSRYLLELDGQIFLADSIDALRSLLDETKEIARETVPTLVNQQNIRIKPPKLKVSLQSGATIKSKAIKREVEQTQNVVNSIYQRANKEIQQLRKIAREVERKRQEEDDIITSLLL